MENLTKNDTKMTKICPKMIKWPILTACRDLYCILMIFVTIYEHIWQLKSERNPRQGSQTSYFYYKMTQEWTQIMLKICSEFWSDETNELKTYNLM